MDIDSIRKMVSLAQGINLDDIVSSNADIENNLRKIINFIQTVFENYSYVLEECKDSNIRFCDYYDSSTLHKDNIIKFFEASYFGPNKEILIQAFALFVFFKNIEELVYNFDICDNCDELYFLLDNNYYFEDINCVIDYLKKSKELCNEDNVDLEFMNEDNKYKILFSALAYKDISSLEKHIKKALIKKLSGQLSKNDVITLSEAVDHVKDLYGFPLARIQLSDDYRIAYIRKDNVTVILGVTLKTGKNIDYTRYDSVASKSDLIYEEIELFKKGLLKEDSVHFKTIELLKEFQKKNQTKK